MKRPIHNNEVIHHHLYPDDKVVQFFRTCISCKGRTDIYIPFDKAERWNSGELIQNVFPSLSADEREVMINGTHSNCWIFMRGGED